MDDNNSDVPNSKDNHPAFRYLEATGHQCFDLQKDTSQICLHLEGGKFN